VRRLGRWAIGLAALGAACAPPRLVPLVPRPDTRRIVSFEMDSLLVRQAAEIFGAALPQEAALCLEGALVPSPVRPGAWHVRVTAVRPARADSADQYHVFLTANPRSGCQRDRLIGVAHDHPTTPPERPCAHSDLDALALFGDHRVLFSLVFCARGRGAILFQDGRNGVFTWAGPEAPAP
jgi:hypothetical protein